MTREEASKKWCPFSRVALKEGMAANCSGNMHPNGEGYANIYPETRCQHEGCMAWRWNFRDDGFCGLAGK
jgi:hypothetical protein